MRKGEETIMSNKQRSTLLQAGLLGLGLAAGLAGPVAAQSSPTAIDVTNLSNHQHLCERASIRGSIANLRSYPWIESEVASGRLQLHGWWFDLETGDLWCTDSENQNLLPLLD